MSDFDLKIPQQELQNDLDSTAKFNRDELVRGWRDHEGRTPRVLPAIKFAAKTDIGQIRENNLRPESSGERSSGLGLIGSIRPRHRRPQRDDADRDQPYASESGDPSPPPD